MDVDHDLIAAGHPPLHFEFASFHAHMPRHWPDWKDRDATKSPRGRADFEGRAWYIGQIVNAHAALDLLADRAADKAKPWPEFAEYDCASCHQDLGASGSAKRKPGTPPWGSYLALTARAFELVPSTSMPKSLTDLQVAMNASFKPNRERVAKDARAAAQFYQLHLDSKLGDHPRWQNLLARLLESGGQRSKNDATQTRLGVIALYNMHSDMKLTLPADLEKSVVKFAGQTARPSPHDPEAIRTRLDLFRKRADR